jgi:hypothetical protein
MDTGIIEMRMRMDSMMDSELGLRSQHGQTLSKWQAHKAARSLPNTVYNSIIGGLRAKGDREGNGKNIISAEYV